MLDTWKLGDRSLTSRLIVGTGKYKSSTRRAPRSPPPAPRS